MRRPDPWAAASPALEVGRSYARGLLRRWPDADPDKDMEARRVRLPWGGEVWEGSATLLLRADLEARLRPGRLNMVDVPADRGLSLLGWRAPRAAADAPEGEDPDCLPLAFEGVTDLRADHVSTLWAPTHPVLRLRRRDGPAVHLAAGLFALALRAAGEDPRAFAFLQPRGRDDARPGGPLSPVRLLLGGRMVGAAMPRRVD